MGKCIGLFGGIFDFVYIGYMCSVVEMVEQFVFDELCLLFNVWLLYWEILQVLVVQWLVMVEWVVVGVE